MVTNYYRGNGKFLQGKTVSPRVFKFLKKYVGRLLPHERKVVLSFNEYPFRDFVPMTEDGYNGGEKLPSHFVVPCIRFVVSKKFHFLGSLFFHSEYVTKNSEKFGKDMSECIKLYILALENIDLAVVATICPLSAVFHQAVEILTQVPFMEEFDGPLVYSVGSNKDIIHIHDPKYVRNAFIRWFLVFDLAFTVSGKEFEASRYDITDALNRINKPPFLQKAMSNNKYYNQIAVYYFSEEISTLIKRLMKTGYFSPQAMGTSIFINMFLQLFNRFYGLNDSKCEVVDFSKMSGCIEFVQSLYPLKNVYSSEDEDVAACLPPEEMSPNSEMNVSQTPASYTTEKSLATLKQKDMYEQITITTASGRTFEPIPEPSPTKKNRKRNKKKKHKKLEMPEVKNPNSKVEAKASNKKDDLLLLYQNPTRDPPDNGEFLLCTPEKYEEMQLSQNLKSSSNISNTKDSSCKKQYNDKNVSKQGKDNSYSKCGIAEDSFISKQTKSSSDIQKKGRNKIGDENQKKILTPVQNITDINLLERSPEKQDQSALQNSNLNENIRKYKNLNRTNTSAVRKIDLEDESNKENLTKNFISNIPESVLNFPSDKKENSNQDDEIKDISYSISDPDDSTEYQFDHDYALSSAIEDIVEHVSEIQQDHPITYMNEVLCRGTIERLLRYYLTTEQLRELLADENTLKFESFMKFLSDRNVQNSSKSKDGNPLTAPSKGDLVKISVKDNDRVDIERVSLNSMPYPPTAIMECSTFSLSESDLNQPMNKEPVEREKDSDDNSSYQNSVKTVPEDFERLTLDEHEENSEDGNNQNLVRIYPEDVETVTSDDIEKALGDGSEQNLVERVISSKHVEESGDVSGRNLVRIAPEGIQRVTSKLSDYDPLKINKNAYTTPKTKNVEPSYSDSTSDDSPPNAAKKFSLLDYCARLSRNISGASGGEFGESSKSGQPITSDSFGSDGKESNVSDVSSHSDLNISQKTDMLSSQPGSVRMAISDVESHASYSAELSYATAMGCKLPLLPSPSLNDPRAANLDSRSYPDVQSVYSSESEGEMEIYDKAELEKKLEIAHAELQKARDGMPQSEQSDKFFSTDFNSEYDDFDDMIINKHVKMIISKLEEKDEEIARVADKLDDAKNVPSTSKEHSSKRGYVKKEIYPQGATSKTGATKRTIFHRDKTEESSSTPSNVIKNSENSCNKSKIASTKASYNETLGAKNKSQLSKMKDEQYKKVADTISQTIKRFASIFDLPDSDEEKNVRISQASLNFVYDLKRVNDSSGVSDVSKKQKLLDDAYNRLCLSILGNRAANPNAQDKIKELMPILQEIASPSNETKPDNAAKNVLSRHVDKTISPPEPPKENRPAQSRFVREDVQNLWINNFRGIELLFKRLGAEKIYFELTPELFRTDHVEHMMNYIQVNGPRPDTYPVIENCQPVDLCECFDTLKPCGSTLLLDE